MGTLVVTVGRPEGIAQGREGRWSRGSQYGQTMSSFRETKDVSPRPWIGHNYGTLMILAVQ